MIKQPVGHVYIPEWIMVRNDLPITEKLIFGKIVGLTNKDGYCSAMNGWIANQLGVTKERASFYISHLVSIGLLKREVQRDESKAIIGRKLYVYQNQDCIPYTGKTVYPIQFKQDTPIQFKHEGIQEEYIQDNIREVSKEKKQQLDYTDDAREIVSYWNKVRGTAFKALAFLDNYTLWREDYTQAEIMRAINQIKWDNYWSKEKNLTPVWFFRRTNPKGEKIDNIGTFLSAKDPDASYWSDAIKEMHNDNS